MNQETGMHGTTPPATNRHWAAINEVSFVAGMRLLFLIFRLFGRWPFRVLLYPVLLWYVATQSRARRASRDYLRNVRAFKHAQEQKQGQERRKISGKVALRDILRHFATFAEAILDKMLLWGGLYPLEKVRFHGIEVMNRHIVEKRGTLLICSHLGNVELCRVLSRQRSDLKLTVLVHTKHAQAFNRMLAKLDPASQLNLMQVTDMNPATAMLLAERIAQGEFIVIAGDRVPVSPNPRVAVADFLGQPAAFPIGPYVLASILQCPLYMLFCEQTGGIADVYFECLRDSVRLPRQRPLRRKTGAAQTSPHARASGAATGRQAAADGNDAPALEPDANTSAAAAPTQEQVLQQLATDYATHLQAHCLRAPLQWFNFYDFWHLPQLESADAAR